MSNPEMAWTAEQEAAREYTAEELKAHCGKLWDSQWTNVVNHDNCYAGWDKGEAINHAVKMVEDYMRENFDAYAATLRQQAERCPYCDNTGDVHSIDGEWRGECHECKARQAERGDGAVSDEVRLFSGDLDVLANLGFPKTAERIRAVLYRDVAPLLRAPAEQGGRVDAGSATDAQIMAEWFRADGGVHGPNVETVTMRQADYLRFRRSLCSQAALAQNAQGEAVYQERWTHADHGYPGDWYAVSREAYDAELAKPSAGCEVRILHAEHARVPEGMVLVPREPTPEMRAAHSIHGDTSDWWNAVISAAPSHPEDAA
jgi:hypothetical protein